MNSDLTLHFPVIPEISLTEEELKKVVFMFPGQGAQFVNMGRDLYKSQKVFANAVDEAACIVNQWLDDDIRNILYPSTVSVQAEQRLNNTYYTQSAISVISYATAMLWMSRGVTPFLLVGHSTGEFMAAHFAGIFSLRDALFLIAHRGKIMAQLPRGAMLAVRAKYEDIFEWVPRSISLAAVNTPVSCVVAGPIDDIAVFSGFLNGKAIATRLIKTSHAFHSSMMLSVVPAFERLAASVERHEPQIPLISTVTGIYITNEEAIDTTYWSRNIISVVRFSDAVHTVLDSSARVILDAGPGSITTNLARKQVEKTQVKIVPSLVLQ